MTHQTPRHALSRRTRLQEWTRNWGAPLVVGVCAALLGIAFRLPLWGQVLFALVGALAYGALDLALHAGKRAQLGYALTLAWRERREVGRWLLESVIRRG